MRDRVVPLVTRYGRALHRFLYRASGGRIGGRLWGLRVVLLTTTGRRTVLARTASPDDRDYGRRTDREIAVVILRPA